MPRPVQRRRRSGRVVAQARAARVETVQLSRPAFEKIAYRDGPDGILAVVPTPGSGLALVQSSRPPLVLVAEGVEKPGNLGAMLPPRTRPGSTSSSPPTR